MLRQLIDIEVEEISPLEGGERGKLPSDRSASNVGSRIERNNGFARAHFGNDRAPADRGNAMAEQAEEEETGSAGSAGAAFAPAAATSSIPAIEVRALTKVFGSGEESVRALDAVSVDIRQNEFFTLLGPSGCGKTTLLRLIAGFEQPSAGSISLLGAAIGHQPLDRGHARGDRGVPGETPGNVQR